MNIKKYGPLINLRTAALVAVLSSGLLWGASSYTSATVNNVASVKVVEPENALIAVDIVDHTLSITRGKQAICGTITNNMPEPVDLVVTPFFEYNSSLLPGHSTDLILDILDNEAIQTGTIPGTVFAYWEGGKAEIEFEIDVNIIEPSPPEPASTGVPGNGSQIPTVPLAPETGNDNDPENQNINPAENDQKQTGNETTAPEDAGGVKVAPTSNEENDGKEITNEQSQP